MENLKLREGFLYDVHFKAWNFEPEELEVMIKVMDIPYSRGFDKFMFEEIKYHQATALQSLSNANGSIFWIDNEKKGCSVEYHFENKKGMFDHELVDKMTYFLTRMENTNKIDCFIVNQNKVEILGYDWEFKITPNSTKTVVKESNFAGNVLLLMLKEHYGEAFKIALQDDYDVDVLSSIKYVNKWLKTAFRVNQKDITNNRKVA